ncbi:MAG: translation initiation factor IF-2 [Alphaproteobacteria bacterium]|nr:translation initiation factor IF-2 [Alphaproteobacteria bacterium]
MNEAKDQKQEKEGAKLSLGGGKGTLSLKGNVGAQVRQSMTQGARGGHVAVEVRRKRGPAPGESSASVSEEDVHLTNEERDARARALQQAMEGGQKKTSLPQRRITIEDKKKEEAEKAATAAEDARKREIEEMNRIEGEEGVKKSTTTTDPALTVFRGAPGRRRREDEEEEGAGGSYRDRLKKAVRPGQRRGEDENARTGGRRITVAQALNEDYERDQRGKSLAAQKRAREKARLAAQGSKEPAKKVFREVILPETITVGELANRMSEPPSEVIKSLMKMGVMATITQTIDADTAELVATELGHKIKRVTEADVETGMQGEEDTSESLQSRPPVVTIMGHVDHGKTSLLDALRETDVVSGEAGGITQHIGAYQVTLKSGARITFLDTPGHAAFTEMRARGANITDIVVVVVSAEDSIMPQTIEAIQHAKAAKVPIIIAINKIDMPDANPAKVKQDLLQHEIIVEELSGETLCVEVSAKKKINLDKLEESILLQAEVLDLKANPDREAHGMIIESKMEKGRGSVASVLIQKGTLRVGDVFVAGAESGRVRAILNDRGQSIDEAIPGQPVEVLGLGGTPDAGDPFTVVHDENKARQISEYRQRKKREAQAVLALKGRTTMEDLLQRKAEGEKTVLPVIIKGDVHGSVEAIAASLQKMATENEGIAVQVLLSGVGGITESDVTLAKASKGLIIGFNVRANAQARDLAQRDGVDIRYYNIIYNVIDDAKAILSGMLSPTKREEYLGQARVQQVFNITKVGKIAGCMVTVGIVKRGSKVRLLRDDVVIHEGMLKTLKRFKDEVKEVNEGTECGMAFENYDDLKENDVIECYEIVEEARTVT